MNSEKVEIVQFCAKQTQPALYKPYHYSSINDLKQLDIYRWVHDYQDACVDKVEKFLSGEMSPMALHPSPSHSLSSTRRSSADTDKVLNGKSG